MSHISLPVEEFTTPAPVVATEDEFIDRLEHLMRQYDIRHIPIIKNGLVVGIVSDRDLKVASGLSAREKIIIRASDIMAVNPVTVNAGATLDEVAFEMSENKVGSVIVNDENDKFYGIFTVTDALNALVEITRAAEIDERTLKNMYI